MAGFKDILKHSGNYLLANLATKALAFISIPIYTRLLSPSEYGIYSIFLGVVGIISSILTLCIDQAISRYFFEQKDPEDFRKFVGTSSILAFSFFLINSFLLVFFAEDFGKLVNLNKSLVYLIIPFSLVSVIGLAFEQIFGPLKKSRQIAISSLARGYIGVAISITLTLILKTNKYFGPVIGPSIAGFIMIVYWVKCISQYYEFSFDKKYLKYIFTYSVPLIPYALSGVLIEQFGKIAIGSTQSVSNAGFYSLALLIGSIVSIAIVVAHQAFNPYYFEYMMSENYDQHDKDQSKIFRLTLFVAVIVAAFGSNIGVVIAKNTFTGSFYLIPVFTLGYIFYQFAYIYMRNFSFSKKTHFLTLTVLISGISNVILNMLLIKKIGELGAALSFVLAYIIMAVTAWGFNKFFVKQYGTPLKMLFVPFVIALPFYLLIFLISTIHLMLLAILFKLMVVLLFGVITFWKERASIFNFLRVNVSSK